MKTPEHDPDMNLLLLIGKAMDKRGPPAQLDFGRLPGQEIL
jgi:hypothetical protein